MRTLLSVKNCLFAKDPMSFVCPYHGLCDHKVEDCCIRRNMLDSAVRAQRKGHPWPPMVVSSVPKNGKRPAAAPWPSDDAVKCYTDVHDEIATHKKWRDAAAAEAERRRQHQATADAQFHQRRAEKNEADKKEWHRFYAAMNGNICFDSWPKHVPLPPEEVQKRIQLKAAPPSPPDPAVGQKRQRIDVDAEAEDEVEIAE